MPIPIRCTGRRPEAVSTGTPTIGCYSATRSPHSRMSPGMGPMEMSFANDGVRSISKNLVVGAFDPAFTSPRRHENKVPDRCAWDLASCTSSRPAQGTPDPADHAAYLKRVRP